VGVGVEGLGRLRKDDMVQFGLVARLNCCISTDPGEALQGVRMSAIRSLSTYTPFATAAGVEFPPNLTEAVSQLGYTNDHQKLETLTRLVPDDLIRDATLVGTVEEVTGRVVSIIERGITQVTIRASATARQGIDATLEAFATQVMPQVRQRLR